MKPWKFFRDNILYPGCCFFTVCVFVFAIVTQTGGAENIVPGFVYMFLLFVFSLLLAALNRIFYSDMTLSAKVLLHFAGLTAAFAVVFVIAGGYYKYGTRSVLTILLFYVLCYFVIFSVIMAVRSVTRKRRSDKSEYKKQF